MNKTVLAFLVTLLVVPCGLAQPESGYIRKMRYRIDKEGERSQPSVQSVTWFTTTYTRKEIYEEDILKAIHVDGEHRWNSYPRISRFSRHGPTPWEFRSYPEEVKWFAERYAGLTSIGRNRLLGYPCDIYTWHVKGDEPARKGQMNCLPFPEYNVTCWAYTNDNFPENLRHETSRGNGTEIDKMNLNGVVPAELFHEPHNYNIIMPITIPANHFVINIVEQRSSSEYGWHVKSIHNFVREREMVLYSLNKTTTDAQGKVSEFSSKTSLSAGRALSRLSEFLRHPYWSGVVSEESQQWQNKTVSVYAPDSLRQALGHKWWVIDHPEFGTITIKRTEENQHRVIEVTELSVGGKDLELADEAHIE
jgi:hypothetical protein